MIRNVVCVSGSCAIVFRTLDLKSVFWALEFLGRPGGNGTLIGAATNPRRCPLTYTTSRLWVALRFQIASRLSRERTRERKCSLRAPAGSASSCQCCWLHFMYFVLPVSHRPTALWKEGETPPPHPNRLLISPLPWIIGVFSPTLRARPRKGWASLL